MLYKFFIAFIFIISLPLIVIIGISSAFFSGFPILYKQTRVGKRGRHFILYKFRTMRVDAEILKPTFKHLNEADGPVFKIRNDPRLTRIGRFLNHTGLDELPQLFNVLKGEMALIGPRPLPVDETARLRPWQKKRLGNKPGIISPWILDGYHKQTFADWMRSDITYLKHKSIFYDMRLFVRIVIYMLKLITSEIRLIRRVLLLFIS